MKPDTKEKHYMDPANMNSHINKLRESGGSCQGLGREMGLTVNGHRVSGYKDEKT